MNTKAVWNFHLGESEWGPNEVRGSLGNHALHGYVG